MIATPSPVEQARAEVEGGDMSTTKERKCQSERKRTKELVMRKEKPWGLCPQTPGI